jgi:hypothetical protein
MGTQFFWFYDVLLIAVLLGLTYSCTRKGFTTGVVNFVGTLLGFALALVISAPAASQIYNNFVSPGVIEQISYTADNSLSDVSAVNAFTTLRETDMSKAYIGTLTLEEFLFENKSPEGETMKLNLMAVNLLSTGITEGDLSFFGLDAELDFRFIDVGYIDITAAERAAYMLEDIVLARIVSYRISERASDKYNALTNDLINTLPGVTRASRGTVDVVGMALLAGMRYDAESLAELVDTYMVRPVTIVPFRMFVFSIIFALVSIAVSAVAKSQDFSERFTLAAKVNTALGLVMGLAFSGLIAAVLVVAASIIIAMTGDTIIFLNTMTIEQTYIFRHLYNIDFLNFEVS